MIDRPPSTTSVLPVMKDASSLDNHKIGQAISFGMAQRANSEVSFRSCLSNSKSSPAAVAFAMWKSVRVEPGQTAFARTPWLLSSKASVRVKASSAALVAS